jgi:hypothetical protein
MCSEQDYLRKSGVFKQEASNKIKELDFKESLAGKKETTPGTWQHLRSFETTRKWQT